MAAEQTVEEQENNSSVTEGKGRATPSRRKSKEKNNEESGNALTRPVTGFIGYLADVRSELNKVTWPSREDTIRLTRIVIAVTILAALALGILSAFLTEFFKFGLNGNDWLLLGIVVVAFVVAYLAMRRSNAY